MEIARCFGTGINVEEARDKVTVILRQPTPVQNMVDQKQSQNMERINYFVRMITNEARYTRIIKSRLPRPKAAFNMKSSLFISKLNLN